ncbi:hypothetical protein [Streptomyces sp. S1]|uniref:hypothetical protein n=1 Tax=Streptomyces sp. S1 TaxID=718288 RepID=UPI003D76326E
MLEDEYGDYPTEAALRFGRDGAWVFAVLYGGWQDEFRSLAPVSRDGAHVFHLEFEEENGKPVPPWFHYFHDERLLCDFNLHLDHSWGSAGVGGDPEVAPQLERLLTAAGLPDENLPPGDAHRTSLHVVERHFGLSLPRTRILEGETSLRGAGDRLRPVGCSRCEGLDGRRRGRRLPGPCLGSGRGSQGVRRGWLRSRAI